MSDMSTEVEQALLRLEAAIANTDNRVENQAIVQLQILSAIQGLEPQQQALSVCNTPAHAERLAALEAAALAKPLMVDADYPAPHYLAPDRHWSLLLRELAPDHYSVWQDCYDNAIAHYTSDMAASCSTWDNRFAVAFRDYLSLFAQGNLLDIGCGTQEIPVYLEGYPTDLLRGLEPREPATEAAFEIRMGVNEFLPWSDASFQTVCNATSLDHVIDIEKSIDESARVLGEGGRFVIWYAHISDADKPLGPSETAGNPIEALDSFHLFHINDAWFMPMMLRRFRLIDRRTFQSGSFSHVFAAYEKR